MTREPKGIGDDLYWRHGSYGLSEPGGTTQVTSAAEAPDAELLRRFAGGDRGALGVLAGRHERGLLGLALGLLGGRRELAMDAVQEMWVKVIRFAGSFRGDSAVKTWLYRILVNQCRAMRGSMPAVEAGGEIEALAAAVKEDERLKRAVEGLGDAHREVVLLCYHGGVTHEVAAEVLNVPLGTLKSRVHAALRELRAALLPEGAL